MLLKQQITGLHPLYISFPFIFSFVVRFFKQFFLFTNGQLYHYFTLLPSSRRFSYLYISIDFFANTLWVIIDQPKMYTSLISFFHRFFGGIPAGVSVYKEDKK